MNTTLGQIEGAALTLARYIKQYRASASAVFVKDQADLIAKMAEEFYESVLGEGTR